MLAESRAYAHLPVPDGMVQPDQEFLRGCLPTAFSDQITVLEIPDLEIGAGLDDVFPMLCRATMDPFPLLPADPCLSLNGIRISNIYRAIRFRDCSVGRELSRIVKGVDARTVERPEVVQRE